MKFVYMANTKAHVEIMPENTEETDGRSTNNVRMNLLNYKQELTPILPCLEKNLCHWIFL